MNLFSIDVKSGCLKDIKIIMTFGFFSNPHFFSEFIPSKLNLLNLIWRLFSKLTIERILETTFVLPDFFRHKNSNLNLFNHLKQL